MTKNTIQQTICGLAIAAALIATGLQAQTMTPQSAFAADAGTLSDKFTGLARVLDGKYDYKPGQGVRSTADVLNLIVMENTMLSGMLTGAAPGGRPAPITDAAKMQDALKASYANVQKAIAGMSAADLGASVKFFGRDTTRLGAIQMALIDQHEHLGQLIAYSRVNGVVPPWSK